MPKSNKQRKKEIKQKRLEKATLARATNYKNPLLNYLTDFDPTETTDLTPLSSEMQEIIKSAYTIFSQYAPPEKFSVCTPCCVALEEEEALRTLPLHLLPRKLIYIYNTSAKYPISGKNEVAYLLPRILELIALNEEIHLATELNLAWLEEVPYQDWTIEEKNILEDFALQYSIDIFKVAEQNQRLIWIDAILVMFYRVGIPITVVLDYFLDHYNFYFIVTIADTIANREERSAIIDDPFAEICPTINIDFEIWLEENINQLKQHAIQAILNPQPIKYISGNIKYYIEQGLCRLSDGYY